MDTSSVNKTLSRLSDIFKPESSTTMVPPPSSSDALEGNRNINNNIDYTGHSDPKVNTGVLPDEHPIHRYDEARELYVEERPPFIFHNRSERRRTVVIPTASGKRPSVPTCVELIARPWDANNIFWTLDVNNTRYIVKAQGGAPKGGHKYLYWAGPEEGFEQKPLVFTALKNSAFHDIHAEQDEVSANESDMSDSIPPNHTGKVPPGHKSTRLAALPDRDDDDLVARARHILAHTGPACDGCRVRKIRCDKKPDGCSHCIQHNSECKTTNQTTEKTTVDSDNALQPVHINAVHGIEKTLKRGKRPTRHSELPPRIHSNLNGPTAPKKRRKTDISVNEIKRLQEHSSHFSSPEKPLRHRRAAAENAHSPRRGDPAISQDPPTPSVLRQSSGQPVIPEPPKTFSMLPDWKQNSTTLAVRLFPAAQYQPLKLSNCPTVESLYAKMLSIWNVTEDKISTVMVTFTWMKDLDRMRTMVLKNHQEASFLYLLEQVDDSPCWKEDKGKCVLDIDLVMK